MKRVSMIVLSICSFLILSCQSNIDEGIPQSGPGSVYGFFNREVQVVDLGLFRIEQEPVWFDGYSLMEPIVYNVSDDESVKAEKIAIGASIRGEEKPDLNNLKAYYKMSCRIPGNATIEDQLRTWTSSNNPRLYIAPIDSDYCDTGYEYRTEACKSITITSSTPLFGREADCDITDKIKLQRSGIYTNPIFSSKDCKIIGWIDTGMSVAEYLSMEPFINANLDFALAEIPKELPVKTSFTVDIELADGRHIKNSTSEVTIIK